MPPPTLHILLIGDTSRPEFHEACAALEELAHVTRFADVEAASRRAGRRLAHGAWHRAGPGLPRSVFRRGDRPPPQPGALGPADRDPGKLVRRRAAQRPSPAGRDPHLLAPGGRPHPPGVSPLVRGPRFRVAAAGHRDRRRTVAGLDPCAAAQGQGTGGHLDAAAGNGSVCLRTPAAGPATQRPGCIPASQPACKAPWPRFTTAPRWMRPAWPNSAG